MTTTLYTGVATPQAAVAADESTVYVTPAVRYEVTAVDTGGDIKWRLEVPWPTGAVDPIDQEVVMASLKPSLPQISARDITWPTRPAISRLLTDGRGRIFVYPYVSRFAEGVAERPVDIYSPDGQLLSNATAPNVLWRAAREDFVYASRENMSNGTFEVVRYRLRLLPTASASPGLPEPEPTRYATGR